MARYTAVIGVTSTAAIVRGAVLNAWHRDCSNWAIGRVARSVLPAANRAPIVPRGKPNRQNGIQANTMNAVHKLDQTTIVLVEDDPQSRDSLTSLLEAEGAHVVAVADAETGVEAAMSLMPDAVVCDLDLPAMDGFYLIQRLRDHEIRGDHAPAVAVALTGHTDESWRLRSIGEGFQHFMTKPARPEALVALLSDAIDARQMP